MMEGSVRIYPTKYVFIKSTTVYVPSSELGLSQPISRQRVFPSPQKQGGGGTLACGWGVGGSPNSDDWRKSLALCLLCDLFFYLFQGSENLTSALAELQGKMLDLEDMKTKQFRIQTVTQFMQLFKQREGCTFFLFCPIL